MSDYITETVATLADKAADVGNKDAALHNQKVLQAQKDNLDGQIADEIIAMRQRGEVSSEKYQRLLAEITALSTSLNLSKVDASVAAVKEERLELANKASIGGEMLIAQADAKLYAQMRDGIRRAANGYKTHLNVEVPMPLIAQNSATGKNKIVPIKAEAPEGETETTLEASYMKYQQGVSEFNATGVAQFTIPSLVVDLIGYIVTYPRLYNKFKVYQTMGVEPLNVNRITGIKPATVIGTATNSGETEDINRNDVTTSKQALRALKVAGFTTVTPELVNTLPADMLQTRIADYLAQSLGLKYAIDAARGDGSDDEGRGVTHYLENTAAVSRTNVNGVRKVTGKTNNVAQGGTNIDRREVAKLFAALGGEYQGLVGGLTLATNTELFWTIWANIQDSYPLFSDSRGFDGMKLGPWDVCVDDALKVPVNNQPDAAQANDRITLLAGNFMRAWSIRYGGTLRLNVSYEDRFGSDEITIRAIQHFDTQPSEVPAVAGYVSKT